MVHWPSSLVFVQLVMACVVPAQGTPATATATGAGAGDGAAAKFWAFQPVRSVVVPRPADVSGPAGAVDRFVLARLAAAGLRPAPAAGPHALLRRLSFDLTGLPPTPAMIAEFTADPSAAGYQRLVDRLLASPEFGERWGRHWLDVVRFAESSGGGRSLMFAHAWRYRDYVIDAFNADRPFDVFVQEQIAGDLLPYADADQRNRQLVATGFLELGPTNYELQDKERLRMEVIDEQIDTIGRAFMGLTLGCARCHDHKFDPIPTADYYALAGIFGSTQVLTPGNVSGHVQREFQGVRTQRWRAYQKRRQALRAELARLGKGQGSGAVRRRVLQPAKRSGIVLDDRDAERVGAWTNSTVVAGYLGRGYLHDGDADKGSKAVVFTPEVPRMGIYEIRVSYTSGSNRASNAPVVIEGADGRKTVRVDQRRLPPLDGFVSVGRHRLHRGRANRITLSNQGTDGHVIVDGLQLIPVTGSAPQERADGDRVAQLNRELRALDARKPPPPRKAMAVRDVAVPADGHLHLRGLVRKKGPVVPRGFVTVCGAARPAIPAGQSGRLQLAAWLTRPSHPLTARVYVNRVWHHLFGVGLVATPDNFGMTGSRPSHPALLDWLARRFVTGGWSTKRLVRELVGSRTYRMAVRPSPPTDSSNRLLSHFRRRRLDAESLRDAILMISGQLDRTRGGSTIRKFSTYDYGYRYDSRRRSVYVPRFRSNRLELFDVFDAADPNLVAGARNVSIVAPQALYLMNSPWVMQQARAAATQLLQPPKAGDRLAGAYVMVLGRPPSASERRLARRYLAVGHRDEAQAWTNLFQVLFACLDFRYLN